MKKSLIAAAGATLAVAAMPMAGVFAEGFTDNISVTVAESCIFRTKGTGGTSFNGKSRTFSRDNVAPGTVVEFAGSGATGTTPEIELYCNGSGSNKTYSVTAAGGAETTNGNELKGTSGNIETGTWTESGATSVWVMSVNGGTNWIPVPAKTGSAVVSGASITPGTPVDFSPQYKVYVGTSQANGTYAGSVVYTLSISGS